MANKQSVPVTGSSKSKDTSPLRREAEKAFGRLAGHGWGLPTTWHMCDFPALDNLLAFENARLPKLDVIDRKKELLVRAEVPGLNKKDIDISLSDHVLTVKRQTDTETKEEEGDYHRHEISNVSFARSIPVPSNIDESKVAASLKDGLLEVTLPKAKATKKRSINVQ